MIYIALALTSFFLGGAYWYNQGFIDGKQELKLKYILAEKQNNALWKKNMELVEIIKKHDRTVANCWDEKLEWKE